MKLEEPLDRRRVLAGSLGVGLAATVGIHIAGAQDETATPEAGEEATPTDGVGGVGGDDETADATEAIEQATAAIAAAQTDRDAVAGQIDTLTIDELLTEATALRDRAQEAATASDADQARFLAWAAAATAKAAGDLVRAQLTTAGLPSQEAPASRVLAGAYEAIQTASDETADATDADVDFFLTTAQALYQSAFDLCGDGSYGQAASTARVAARLARIAEGLADPDGEGFGGGRGRGRRGRGEGPGPDRDEDPDADRDEPVPVPEPSF